MTKKLAAFILLGSVFANADISYSEVLSRCDKEVLDREQALVRNQWAKKCLPEFNKYVEGISRNGFRHALVRSPSRDSWQGPLDSGAPCDDWKLMSFCKPSTP